jgi:hypothetical protein
MIPELLAVLKDPDSYALTYRKGEFHVASIADLQARKATIRGLSVVEVDGTPMPAPETQPTKAEPHEER